MQIEEIRKQWRQIMAAKELKQVSELLRQSPERDILMQRGKELCAHTFVFDHPWDMERCLTPHTLEIMNWNQVFNEDEEWTFMLNRMDYWSVLAKAALISQDTRYLDQAKDFLLDWIAQHPHIEYSLSTRTLDTGIRIVNMLECAMLLEVSEKLTEEELRQILDSVDQQMTYLKANYIEKYTLSNWGSIQTCGLIVCCAMMGKDPETDEIYRWALDELETQVQIQIGEDGMLWEQSTMYHVEVLNNLLRVLEYAQFYPIPLSSQIKDKVHAMVHALMHMMMPDHQIETFGDSDRVNAEDVMNRGAVLFDDPQLRAMGNDVGDSDLLVNGGMPAWRKLQTMPKQTPTQLLYAGADCGIVVRRSDFGPEAEWMMVLNGELGSGHGHSDNLHYSLVHRGVPFVIDPGRFTYREDHPVRVELKGMSAHNTVVLDDQPGSVPDSSWTYQKFLRPLATVVRDTPQALYWEGGVLTQQPQMTHIRKMIMLPQGCWLICDEIFCAGEHKVVSRIQLDPQVTVIGEGADRQLKHAKAQLQYHHEGLPLSVQTGPCSLRYNELLDHSVLVSQGIMRDQLFQDELFYGEDFRLERAEVIQPGRGKCSVEEVSAWRFIRGEETYTCVIFHQQLYQGKKILFCEGLPLHNQACLIIRKGDQKKLIRLK
ncbi:alginate lyase family protein [Holdemania massiliensis]|uniref:alginate lyase family protein n=1 Tax=Holdemania massiliensis TaxID=1468449 RepID=UPI001F056565|nr:alginate lyase family protein [Holdemania massiliensis]MCH1940419.1 heparinase II/III family protein [Holdemania massiliensis]